MSEIADELGLHRNSVRFHLDALVEAGFASRQIDGSGLHGRPPTLYTATQASPAMSSLHMLELTDVLLGHIADSSADPTAELRQAGVSWGARLAEPTISADDVVPALAATLAARGFGTEQRKDTLCFTRCPFRDMIDDARLPLVCTMHAGVIEGYLAQSAGEHTAGELRIGRTTCDVTIAS